MKTPEREVITFTRKQFYEKVWSTPATKVAVEIGISDVMVGRICKSYNIPKPYLGYWAKLEHGKKPKRKPLPENSISELEKLTFCKDMDRETTAVEPIPEPVYDADIQEMLDLALSLEPLKVAESLRNPHPLVAATRDRIKRDRIPFRQRSHNEMRDSRPTLHVDVANDSTARSLRIMDSLIKRIEMIGGSVEVCKEKWNEHRTQTFFCLGGEDVSIIRLREKHKQVRLTPSKKNEYSWRSMELEPTGLLVLDTGPGYSGNILLCDTLKRRRIEEGLNNLVISFIRQAGRMRIKRREEEEVRKQREEEERIRRQKAEELRQKRDELQKRQKVEQCRVDQLADHAQAWQNSQLIRGYLGAVCDMLLERDGAIAIDGEAAAFLRWAYKQADRLDPLSPNPSSVLDERI